MARLARIIAPGFPHHITQRGNRRQPTFFQESDYWAYVELLAPDCPILQAREISNWGEYLAEGSSPEERDRFQRHERTGRPLGSKKLADKIGRILGRDLQPRKPGRKPKAQGK